MVLVIREAQMTMMRNAALSSFRRRLGTHVRSFLPNAGEGEISTVVDRVVRDCAAYSLERECDIARYATIILSDGSCAGGVSAAEEDALLAHGVPAEERLSQFEGLIMGREDA